MREFKKLPLELFIGYDIEQNSRVIELDASEMVEQYPSGILQLVCKRPGEETTYIAPSFEQDGGTLRWTLTSYDVEKAGQGLAIVALVDTSEESVKVLASHKIRTGIEEGLHFRDAETVDPEDSLIARVLAAVSQAQAYAQDAAEALGDVQDEHDQAIADIEAKGAETLASIPSDYTALSGDVSDLKSAMDYETDKRLSIGKETFPVEKHLTYAQIPFEHGIVYASKNELVYSSSSTGIRTTEIYNLEAGDVISLTDFTQAFIAYLGFYHTDGTWRALLHNLTEAYTVVYPGRYYVTLKKTGSPNITDVDSVAAYLNITKNKTAFEKVKEYTEENIPPLLKTQAFYNNLDDVNLIKKYYSSVTQGRYNPFNVFSSTVEDNNKRICGQFVYDAKSITFRCDNPSYKLAYACYETDGTYITGSGGNAFHNAGIYTVEGDIHYIRYMIAKVSSSATIVPDDIIDAQFYITETINNAVRLSDIRSEDFTRMKVCTYNIGHFSYGTDPYGMPSDIYDTKLKNWFKFFGENMFDVCGVQEDYKYLDRADTVLSEDNFWSKLFKYNAYRYNQSGFGWESLRSRYAIHNAGIFQTTVDETTRTYRCGDIYVNGKEIFLLSVHLYPSQESDGPTVRAEEFAQIATLLATKEYFIVFGDFNTMSTSEWDTALNDSQGNKICNMANGGLYGWKWTFSNNPADYSDYDNPTGTKVWCLDNILTSKNIQIEYADVINCYSQTTSDHIPLFASLLIY